MHTTTTTPTAHADAAERRSWWLAVLLCVAQFMVVLDITVVNVALPSIDASLGFASGDLQWVVTAYVLFTGGLLLLGGRAADLLGRRRMFLTGLSVFTAASLASGLAPSPGALVAARAAQGLGAALLTPAALSIITTTWLSWEWVFLVNVPVGLVAGALALHLVPSARPAASGRQRLDLPGALSVVAGLVVLVYALEGTAEHGWGSAQTLVLLALAGGLLATFAAVERSVALPLVPPQTWRVRPLASSAVVMLGVTGILIGTFFLNSLYLQNVLGASALENGLDFLPLALAIGLAAHLASHLLAHAGSRVVVVTGLALVAAGALLLAAAPDQASYATDLLPGFLVIGIGVGFVFPAVSVTAMSDVESERAGLASGLMTTAHEIGAALGVAVFSAVAIGTADGPAAAGGFAAGYEDGFLTAALIATGLALVAAVAVPTLRAAGPVRGAIH